MKIIIIRNVKYKKSKEIEGERNANKKTFSDPIIDERDEYLVAYKITNHDTPKTKVSLKDKAKTTPR